MERATIQLALHAGEKAIRPRVIVPTTFAASPNELSQLVALFNYSSPCGAPRGQKTPFHHDQAAHQLSHRARDIHILFTTHNGLTLTMYFAAQGNEMKIQKVFEAFEQFHLGEETLSQLVTQLEASLMQVTT